MHPVSTRVEIPLDQIERILTARAVPDFTGSVEISVRVLPTAGHEVEFTAVVENVVTLGRTEEVAAPHVTNNRVNAVRFEIAKLRDRFFIRTDIQKIRASFVKGDLRSFKICEAE